MAVVAAVTPVDPIEELARSESGSGRIKWETNPAAAEEAVGGVTASAGDVLSWTGAAPSETDEVLGTVADPEAEARASGAGGRSKTRPGSSGRRASTTGEKVRRFG